MIVKMIQNLENKMESQINSLETRIEKTQERFNKDLEEIKKSQYIMNNAINKEKAMATHSSTLAWRIPWVEEPGRLQSMGLLRVRHDCVTSFSLHFNAINEIKNTLETTNSRITEAEDRISEVEDRMVEINESERKK